MINAHASRMQYRLQSGHAAQPRANSRRDRGGGGSGGGGGSTLVAAPTAVFTIAPTARQLDLTKLEPMPLGDGRRRRTALSKAGLHP